MFLIFGGFIALVVLACYIVTYVIIGVIYALVVLAYIAVFVTLGVIGFITALIIGLSRSLKGRSFTKGMADGWTLIINPSGYFTKVQSTSKKSTRSR